MNKVTHGLNKLERNGTEFRVGALFTLPKIEELPANFTLGVPFIKFQADSDFCSGESTCGAREFQEGVELCPEWSFAKSKEMTGDVENYGQNLKDACKVHVKFGAIEKSESPFSLQNKPAGFLRDIKNWPDLTKLAEKHKAESYIEVASFSDHFDTIKKTIWRFREEKRAVVIGVEFGWPLSDIVMEKPLQGGGHAMYTIGWENINGSEHLIVINSYGLTAGEQGKHYFSREVINTYAQDYGAFMFHDLPPEQISHMLENGIKAEGNWVVQILKLLKTLILSPFLTISEKSAVVTTISETVKTIPQTETVPTPPPVISHSDAWCGGTLEERLGMYDLASRIADQEGHSAQLKREYLATIMGESGFNQWCKNNRTFDYGICQFNKNTYLKEYSMTADYAIEHPKDCLRIMAQNFKTIRKNNWVAYSSGGYKKFLDKKPTGAVGSIDTFYYKEWINRVAQG